MSDDEQLVDTIGESTRRTHLKMLAAATGIGVTGTAGVQFGSSTARAASASSYGIQTMTDDGSEAPFYPHGPHTEYVSSEDVTFCIFRGPSADPYAMKYDHTADSFSGPVKVGTNPLPDDDEHGVPALCVDDDGIIHVFYGCHGGYQSNEPIQHARSDTAYDVSSWTNSDIGEYGTYTSCAVHDNNVYVIYRKGTGSQHEKGQLSHSNDGGDTWTHELVADFSTGGDDHNDFYIVGDMSVIADNLHFTWVINFSDTHDANRENVYHAVYDTPDSDGDSDRNVLTYDYQDLGSTITWAEKDDCLIATQDQIWSVNHIYDSVNDRIHFLYQNDADGDGSWQFEVTSIDRGGGNKTTQQVPGATNGTPANYGKPRINDAGNLEVHVIQDSDEGGEYHVHTYDGGSWTDDVVVQETSAREPARIAVVRNGLDEFAAMIAEGETTSGDSNHTVWAAGTNFSSTLVDNDDSGASMTGSWSTSTYADNYIGDDYLHDGDGGKGDKSVTFNPGFSSQGDRTVSIYYNSSSTRATNVPVDVVHDGGTTTYTVDMSSTGGQWDQLGTHTFTGDGTGKVVIRNDGTDGYVIADAVQFE